jgi:small subunit ribosomal protein S6e
LADEYKGYVWKINGGFDNDGFAMKQGVFVNGRVRLLLSPGSTCYRAKRTGERKRRSVRGCIVGPDVKMLSVSIVKKGDNEIPGLTDTTMNRRLGPKRANNIRKLFGIEKQEGKDQSITTALIKKNVTRRTFKSKKNPEAPLRQKAPKIQRLITDVRLRRKKIQKEQVVRRWKKTIEQREEYKKVVDSYVAKRRAAAHDLKVQRKESTKNVEKEVPAKSQPAQSGKATGA